MVNPPNMDINETTIAIIIVYLYPFLNCKATAVGNTIIDDTTSEPTTLAPIATVIDNNKEWIKLIRLTLIPATLASSSLYKEANICE